jgi:hypothetical protein
MQTVLIELKNSKALEELHHLEERKFIRIVNEDSSQLSLPGKPINVDEFRSWVEYAENTSTISLNEAKQQWGGKEEETTKPYSVRITDNAQKNIDNITGYIAFINHEPLNAIRVGDAIYDTIAHIGQYPFAFRECEEMPTKNQNL